MAIYRLYGGQKGGGKSWAVRREAVRQSGSKPGLRGLLLRRTYDEIEQNTIIPLQKELPQGAYTYHGGKHVMTFPNDSTINFSYCRTLKDVFRYQGLEFDFIGIEELTHWTEQEFRILMTSLRTSRDDRTPNFFGSTNPGGVGHGWVKRLWINRDFEPSDGNPDDYAFVSASVWDNPSIMENDPGYMARLDALPEKLRRAYKYGDWDVFDGQYFTEFNRDVHVIDPMIPKDYKKYVIAFDYGYSKPSCVLWMAKDSQDNVVVYRELYVIEHTYDMLFEAILAHTTDYEKKRISKILPDPAIVSKKSETDGVDATDVAKKYKLKLTPANNERIGGWNNIRQHLKPFTDPNSGEKTAKIKITSNCNNLVRTLPEQLHDDTKVEDLDTNGEDHAADALRYGLAELSQITTSMKETSKINEKLQRKNDFDDSRKATTVQGVTINRGGSDNVLSKQF